MNDIFEKIFTILEERKKSNSQDSYVCSLYQGGSKKINEKIKEESQEVIEAALEKNKKNINYEICDLLFHVFVLAQYFDINLEEIKKELLRRFGTSGITEKENRNK